MFEVSKKNEKFIGANKNQNKYQNKESRGESPVRKTSTNNTMPNRNLNQTSSMGNTTFNSIPPTPGTNSKSKNKLQQLSRNASVVPLSNNAINIDIINTTNNNNNNTNNNNFYIGANNNNNNILKILDRPSSGINKNNNLQQMVNITPKIVYLLYLNIFFLEFFFCYNYIFFKRIIVLISFFQSIHF